MSKLAQGLPLVRGRVRRKYGPDNDGTGGGEQDSSSSAGQDSTQPGAANGEGQAPKTFDETYVQSIRKEAADERIKRQDLEKRLKAIEDAELTESQKAAKERDEALKELETLRRDKWLSDVKDQASKLGAKYPDLVALKVPEGTKPDDVPAAIKAINKDYPDLFQHAEGDAGVKGGDAKKETTPGMGTLREAYAQKQK